jgi:hypothetical protein
VLSILADSEEDGATNKEEYSGSQIDDAEFYELNDTEVDENTNQQLILIDFLVHLDHLLQRYVVVLIDVETLHPKP